MPMTFPHGRASWKGPVTWAGEDVAVLRGGEEEACLHLHSCPAIPECQSLPQAPLKHPILISFELNAGALSCQKKILQ